MADAEPPPAAAELAAATQEVQDVVQAGSVREASELPPHLQNLPEQGQWLELLARRQELQLKGSYAKGILWLLGLQFAVADLVFIVYAWAGRDWNLSAQVIDVWLGATVVQVIGVVQIVTRHLFPRRDNRGGA
jgi:hypothetical protein